MHVQRTGYVGNETVEKCQFSYSRWWAMYFKCQSYVQISVFVATLCWTKFDKISKVGNNID